MQKFKLIKSVYLCQNKENTNVILKGDFIHLAGEKYIIEEINGLKFMVHPNSFLQVNHDQAEAMYKKAISYVKDDFSQNIIDAYCGIGSITLGLASKARHVYGIEIVEEAIRNANENKKLNNKYNVDFLCGKCEDEIEKLINLTDIDTIVVDPPRKGCDQKFLDTVIKMNIKNIIYISCMPQTFARDIDYLKGFGYELKEVTPFDLFSHTEHTELVSYITKKEPK
jgi:23S rRNA (uracil1939-C5)-methyltransferase